MSSDNGLYILKTPKENSDGFEYRVIHAQAINNIYFDDTFPNNNNPEGTPKEVIAYFGNCEVLTEEAAQKKAFEMYDEIIKDDFCPIVEYGICSIDLPHSFQWYRDQLCQKAVDRFCKGTK